MERKRKIGNVEIPNRVVVVPMARITNSAFRVIVREFSAGLVVREMTNDQGIHFRNKKALEMPRIRETEHPLSLQIFDGNKGGLVKAAQSTEGNTATDIMNINMGFPVNKVIETETGAKQLLNPEKVYEMVQAASSTVDTLVTVRTRIGWSEEHIFTVENALITQSAGANTITMHGHTRVQMCEGKADWGILKGVEKHLAIPFMGNGDVKIPKGAKRMLDYVGADGAAIGQAVSGNPWVIHHTQHYLETGGLIPEPAPAEKTTTAKLRLQHLVGPKGGKAVCGESRIHAVYYLGGIPRAAKAKIAINQTENQQGIDGLPDQFMEKTEKVLLKQALWFLSFS